ncbi:hypothetical protein [Blastococcus sp. PRF04-17]|uniref:hypothetical protein n=1 Tax=Blastococcus sp. PRF04-17 TaxID=2933797 RepID=UPI001FF51552|nr:hypothetical protein [Blastococcus sp. PRF04-17]UOY02297.1 hypothetical protein MVA48_02625 [Blastococcus sp. PRF04-17]
MRPDVRHEMTRRDVLEGNVDLMERAGSLLAGKPRRRLDVTAFASRANHLVVQLTVGGLDRVDVYLDGRPRGSSDVSDGASELRFDDCGGTRVIQVMGFQDGELVAARTEQLG